MVHIVKSLMSILLPSIVRDGSFAVTSESFEEESLVLEAAWEVSPLDESAAELVSASELELVLELELELESASLELDLPQLVKTQMLRVSAISIAEILFIISFFLSRLKY